MTDSDLFNTELINMFNYIEQLSLIKDVTVYETPVYNIDEETDKSRLSKYIKHHNIDIYTTLFEYKLKSEDINVVSDLYIKTTGNCGLRGNKKRAVLYACMFLLKINIPDNFHIPDKYKIHGINYVVFKNTQYTPCVINVTRIIVHNQ